MAATKKKKPPRKTIPKLEAELWTLFSIAVRVIHSDKGKCKCVTCNKSIATFGGGCHAGHFRPRTEKFVKYEFTNVHPQCATCNTFKDGEQYLHGLYIDARYGEGVANKLTEDGHKVFKDEGIDLRTYLEDKRVECLTKLGEHLENTEWQTYVTKTTLKEIHELHNKQA